MKLAIHLKKVCLLLPLLLLSAWLHADSTGSEPVSNNPVWIDVRSEAEYQADHIDGDLRITHTDIVAEVMTRFPDPNTEIRLYCRSGKRAGMALNALKEANYKNVSNAGGIQDARIERNISQ